MKRILSCLLVIALVLGIAPVAFAATAKITDATAPIDYNKSYDLDSVAAGSEILFPLTANMFDWSEGKVGGVNEAVTSSQISSGDIKLRYSISSGDSAIDKIELVYQTSSQTGSTKTATVRVKFVDNLPSVNGTNFKLRLYLYKGSTRQTDSEIVLEGTLEGKTTSVGGGTDYFDLSKGAILEPDTFIRDIELYLGEGVTVTTNVYADKKYYGTAKIEMTEESVLDKYPSVEQIIVISAINLSGSVSRVRIDADKNYYVYNASKQYIGRTNDSLPYSAKYYLSTKSIDMGGGSSSSSSSQSSSGSSSSSGTPSTAAGDEITVTKATEQTTAALRASGSKYANVIFKDASSISGEALRAMQKTAAASGATVSLLADNMSGSAVRVRLTINPANATNLSGSIKLGAYVDDSYVSSTRKLFSTWFQNNVAVVSLSQQGSFGLTVEVAAKVDLSSFGSTANLTFYTYDKTKNQYTQLTNTGAYIDTNGYLHFKTTYGGDIIISEGPLRAK